MGKWAQLSSQVQPHAEEQPGRWQLLAQQSEKQEAQESLTWGQAAKQAVSNVPQSAVEFGKDVVTPFVHPVETTKGLINLALGAIEKIPGARHLTPGPAYDMRGEPDKRQQAIDGVVEFFSDRYGSTEGFKRAVAKDPVGVVSDGASVLVGGGGVLKGAGKVGKVNALTKSGSVLTKMGAQLEPLNVATMPLRGAKKLIPKRLSSRLYEGAAKFSTTLSTEQRNAIVKTALDKQVMPTYKGLLKLGDQIEDLNTQIAGLIDIAVDTGERIPLKRLLRGFSELKKNARFSGKPADARRAVNNIRKQLIQENIVLEPYVAQKKVKSSIVNERGEYYVINKNVTKRKKKLLQFTPAQAQKLKQKIYRELEGYYSSVTDNSMSVRAQQAVARNAKEAIEVLVPEIKQLNKRDGDLIALKKQIEKVAPRISNRDLLSLGTTAKAAGGGVVFGKAGLAAGLALGLLDSQPVIKAHLALLIHKMRDRGMQIRMTPTVVRLLSEQTGRAVNQNLEE